jgi:DNA-binding NtrC family response regulator
VVLARAASSDATVLIEGEPGSGKSRAARHLHELSPRREGSLVVVDLAALPASLVEAELFGHEVGAFTGARVERLGRFRRAAGGTIVLEGVENLAVSLQAKLLRVLQERVVEPLGGETPVPIDVRVVATSTRALHQEVAADRFRQDLYWRLAVVVLQVPPLRLRRMELAALVAELGPLAALRAGVANRILSPEALALLAEHPWPGNVRELENALERVMVLGSGDQRLVAPVEFGFLQDAVVGAAQRLAREAVAQGVKVGELEQALLRTALSEHRGNHAAAARALGLSRRAFEYRLQHHQAEQQPDVGSGPQEPA